MNSKVIRSIFFVAVSVFFLSSCSSKTQYLNSWYLPDTVKKDKSSAKGMFYDNKSAFLYKISNDNQFLVADLQINNEAVQKKILLFGLTMWIDTTGKTKKNIGIKYPLGSSGVKKSQVEKMKELRGNFKQRKKIIADNSYEIAILGQKGKDDTEIVDKRYKIGIKANITFDSFGIMYYQLKIPYDRINLSFNRLMQGNPGIGFETGHAEMNQRPGQGGGMKPGGGGGGGKHGGMKPGGGTPGLNPDMQAMMQATSFWIKNIKFANIDE